VLSGLAGSRFVVQAVVGKRGRMVVAVGGRGEQFLLSDTIIGIRERIDVRLRDDERSIVVIVGRAGNLAVGIGNRSDVAVGIIHRRRNSGGRGHALTCSPNHCYCSTTDVHLLRI